MSVVLSVLWQAEANSYPYSRGDTLFRIQSLSYS